MAKSLLNVSGELSKWLEEQNDVSYNDLLVKLNELVSQNSVDSEDSEDVLENTN